MKNFKRVLMIALSFALVLSNQNLNVFAASYTDSNLEDEVKVDTVEIKKDEEILREEFLEKFDLEENNVSKEIEVITSINGEDVNLGTIQIIRTLYHVVFNDEVIFDTLNDETLILNQEGIYKICKGDLNAEVSIKSEIKNQFNSLSLKITEEKAKLKLAELAQSNAQKEYDEVKNDYDNADASYEEALAELEEEKENLQKAQAAYDEALAKYNSVPSFLQGTYKKLLDAAASALESAKAKVEEKEQALSSADSFKQNLEVELAEKETELNEKKAATESAQISVTNAENALNNYVTSVKNDLTNNVDITVEYVTTDELVSAFTTNIYNELSIIVEGLEGITSNVIANNTNGITENGFKVYLSNNDVTITVPQVEGYKVLSVKLNGEELSAGYAIGTLTDDSTVTVTYAESTLSDIQILDVLNGTIEVKDNEGNIVLDNSIVVEGTTLFINATANE